MKLAGFLLVGLVVISFFAPVTFGTPVYQTVAFGATQQGYVHGFIEVQATNHDATYGKARVEYDYWKDSGNWWHYAYRIFNGDYYNTPTNKDDDYHLGYVYDSEVTAFLADKINKFSLSIIGSPQGPSDFTVLGTAGSTGGGGVWSTSLDPLNLGVDWVQTGSTGTTIAPAMWNLHKVKGNDVWEMLYAGDRSTGDGTGTYFFQIASKGAPVLNYEVALGVGSDDAQGVVYGPMVPEPATLAILALGGLLLRNRKR